MKINARGLAIIKKWEGCSLTAYKCPANVWTIGFGHTGDVKEGQVITQHQADTILDYDLDRFEEGVANLLRGTKPTENQFSALVSFAFNVGLAALTNSTLLKKYRRGDLEGAANEFARWNKAGGKTLAGLTKRRADEAALFRA